MTIELPKLPVEVMLAKALPDGKDIDSFSKHDWVLEEKYDGHRLEVRVTPTAVTAWARSGIVRPLPPHLIEALRACEYGVYDGELRVPGGTSSDVTALRLQSKLQLVMFDMLEAAGQSCLDLPQYERRRLLAEAWRNPTDSVVISDLYEPSLEALHAIWRASGEGAVVKRLAAPYQPGKRSRDWIKFKKREAARLTVTGFKDGLNGPHSVIECTDSEGHSVPVKTRNTEWLAQFACDSKAFIGRTLVISYQQRTKDGAYRSPMADHFEEDEA